MLETDLTGKRFVRVYAADVTHEPIESMDYIIVDGNRFVREAAIMYQCAECSKPVTVTDGVIIRSCDHRGAAVTANLSAVCYGESSLRNGNPEALKLQPQKA